MKFLIFFLISALGYAQTNPTIRTARPGQSVGAFALGNRIIQLQSGYQYNDLNANDSQLINNVIRYGIGEQFELSTVFDYKSDQNDNLGVDNLQLGARYSFGFKERLIKAIGLQLRTRFKGTGDFERQRQSFLFTTAVAFDTGNSFSCLTNLTFKNDGNDPYIKTFYAVNFTFPASDSTSFFFEPYGIRNRNENVLSINAGLSYTYNSDLAFDLSAGRDVHNSTAKFVSFGLSVRRMP
jgi:hypothetical protein